MATQDTTPTKDKILEVMRRRGPSLPVHVASEIKLSMLFASAFLADLLSNKEIKISHMRVGNTPIYFIAGQEPQLENYSQYLKSREKDAFISLKEKKFLEDEKQEPAIRVALRAIKDFAVPFQKNNKLIWRYFTTPESDYLKDSSKEEPIQEIKKEQAMEEPQMQEIPKRQEISKEEQKLSEISKEELKESIEKEKPLDIFNKSSEEETFIEKVLKYLKSQDKIKVLEETEIKKKEFLGIGRIESNIGEIEIVLIAKDKKKINEKDLEKLREKVQETNKIILFFTNGEIDKKAIEFYRQLKGLIFIKNI